MAIYSIKAPNGKIYDVQAPDGAKQEDLYAYVQQQIDDEALRRRQIDYGPGFLETAGRGIARGTGAVLSTATDLFPAMVGSALGFEDYAKGQLKEAEEKAAAREQQYPTLFRSYKEIEGLGDFFKYATEKTSEQVPNIATALIPGVGVGALAGRTAATGVARGLATQAAERGLAGEAAEQYVKQGLRTAITTSPEVGTAVARGQIAGSYLGSYALNAPEIFQNIYEETKELAPGAAALFSLGSAALDSILPAQLSKQVSGPMRAAIVGKVLEKSGMDKGLVRPLTAAFVKGAATEGLTEGAQEAISIAAEKFVGDNPMVFGSKEWNRIMESAVAGAVAGGAFSTAGRSVERLRESAEQKRQEAAKAEAEGRAQEAEQLRQEAARIEQEAEAASAQIEAAQRPTTEAEREAYGVGETAAFSPTQQFGVTTPQEFKKQEAQFKKDQQALKERLAEYTPEGFVSKEGASLVKKGELDLAGLAQQPSPIEQTLQKAESPLDQLQQRGMRKGELGLEQMRAIGWNEDWNALVPNIAELKQPEFRKALTTDVTIPVETRRGIIEAAKKATLPDGTPIIPKSAKYSYPDASSTKVDDLRKISKDVFGVGASAKFLREAPGAQVGEGGIAGLDMANPEHVPQIRAVLTNVGNTTTVEGAAEKIERLLSKLPGAEGEQRATGIDTEAGGTGVEAPVAGGTPGGAAVSPEQTQRGGVGAPQVAPRRIVGGKEAQPGALTEEEVPVSEKIEDLRSQLGRRKNLTPEETKALDVAATAATAPTEPIPNKTIKKLVNEFFGEHYLDPDSHLYLPKYQGPVFDGTQRALAERGDINGLLRNLLDTTRDPAIKQVLRRLRSLNLKTKLVIGDPTGPMALPATDWYYSALAKGVEQLNMKSSPAASWKSAIQGLINKGQVKKEEVEWTGLNDWLDLQPDKVSKESVLDYLNNKGVQVEETMFDVTHQQKIEEVAAARTRFATLAYEQNESRVVIFIKDLLRGRMQPEELPPALRDAGARLVHASKIEQTQFEGYASSRDNYRELLLRLPKKAQEDALTNWRAKRFSTDEGGAEYDGWDVRADMPNGEIYRSEIGLESAETEAEAIEIAKKIAERNPKIAQPYRTPSADFYSPHWREPNVLAHIRLSDRTDTDGKRVLFVEELQSDWAQQGKKKGMGRVPLTFIEERNWTGFSSYNGGNREFIFADPNGNRYSGYGITEAEAREELYKTLKSLNRIPAGPFVTKTESWVNLALKRIVALAAEEGYDRVAFINALQAHQRFPQTEDGRSTRGPFSAFYGEPNGTVVNDAGEVQKDKKPILQVALEKLLPKVDGKKPITSAFATKTRELLSFSEQREDAFNAVENGVPIAIIDERVVRIEDQLEKYGLNVRSDRVVANNKEELDKILKLFYNNFARPVGLNPDDGALEFDTTEGGPDPSNFVYLKPFRTEHVGFDITEGMYLKTTVDKQPLFYKKSGSYDPATDTIMLDPKGGMNAHTFIHEVIHAAISNVLRNENHPLTKDFQKFFLSIKDRMGGAYGGKDLQEFAAELVSNPSFQALLKTIKTPRSENLFTAFLRKIAEFFGFVPKSTAFDTGLKFVNDAIDITNGIEAVPGERMFLGDGNFAPVATAGKAMPVLGGQAVEKLRNTLSNLTQGGGLLEEALGALRLNNLKVSYGKELPSIGVLESLLERRMGREEIDIKGINKVYTDAVAVQQKFPEQMQKMGDLAIRASQAEVDITRPFKKKPLTPQRMQRMSQTQLNVFNSAEAKRENDHRLMREEYLRLNPEVRNVYATIRQEYDEAFHRYRQVIEKAAEGNPGLAETLKEEFELKHPLTGYVPFRRYGDFWLEFTDPTTDAPVSMAFETVRERTQFVEQNLKGIPHREFQRLEDVTYSADRVPPTHFIAKVIAGLRDKGASQEHINSVYQAYLAAFPAESIAKQFMTRRGIAGMSKDLVRGYGDVMLRWARKLNNSEFLPQIDRALIQIAQEANDKSPDVVAAAKSILRQKGFFHNPTYGKLVSAGTALSYYEFMAGNISSAAINLTSLPLMVFPILSGRFGGLDAGSAVLSAMREATPGNDWANKPEYRLLYSVLMEHGQLEHTMAREVLEARRQKTEDYSGLKARVLDLVSLPMNASEKWNRATTAIAAYNLEYAKTKNKDKAIQYALDTVRAAHTSGMAVTGSRWLQTPFGRIFGTFKSIIWQQAFVIARSFYDAAKSEPSEVRTAARKQLLAMYGMATVFVGVKGMPFYGAMSVLAEMLNTLFGDDDEPFDFDEFMRDLLPMFLYKGLINYGLNIEVANRAGLATDIIFRDDPRGVADHGYVLSALQQAFGPLGSIAVNAERSIKLFKEGEIQRSLEASLPSALRNPLKSWRYMQDGVTTLKGEPIMEDINAYNLAMQVVGFAPADLSNRYEMLSAAKGFEREVQERRQKALRMVDMAITSGDMNTYYEAMERVQNFNQAHPEFAITADSLRRSERARRAAEKDTIYGIRFNKNLLPTIRREFFEEE